MAKLINKAFFVTGTDTGVGKTEVSLAIMRALKQKKYVVAGMKPVACGGVSVKQQLQNEDATRILDEISPGVWENLESDSAASKYSLVNPYFFEQAVAPHIGALQQDVEIEISVIQQLAENLIVSADFTIVEGVGGWQVPINRQQTMADCIKQLDISVILVIGLRLGALNHALLSYHAIVNAGIKCSWIANIIDPDMALVEENIQSLTQRIDSPCLGVIPHLRSPQAQRIADCLNIDALLDF